MLEELPIINHSSELSIFGVLPPTSHISRENLFVGIQSTQIPWSSAGFPATLLRHQLHGKEVSQLLWSQVL